MRDATRDWLAKRPEVRQDISKEERIGRLVGGTIACVAAVLLGAGASAAAWFVWPGASGLFGDINDFSGTWLASMLLLAACAETLVVVAYQRFKWTRGGALWSGLAVAVLIGLVVLGTVIRL
ncbi:MAG: hypothetical protein LBK95_03410 [Bifidobacteriaceae bacterium]|jgi:hypothetical protein|nr:hypothetical protein [Bifidobacteriaceae bacterium]